MGVLTGETRLQGESAMKAYFIMVWIATACLGFVLSGCGPRQQNDKKVVAYVAVDQNYSEPVLQAFSRKTGIEVLTVYDAEAAKTTGLVQRLIAEKGRPQADVFWNGEFAQTIQLKEKGVLASYASPSAADIPSMVRDPENYWCGFAGRARVLIINTKCVAPHEYPRSIRDLLDARWPAEKVALSYPVFGTAATHAAALYVAWGPDKAREFFEQLKARRIRIVPGNSVVRDLVVAGRAIWGVTDTDDAASAIARGAPVSVVFPDQDSGGLGTLMIPGTVALIAGAPHGEEAKALIDYLLSREVERQLVQSGWCHLPLRECGVKPLHIAVTGVKAMGLDLEAVYRAIERAKREMAELFVQ